MTNVSEDVRLPRYLEVASALEAEIGTLSPNSLLPTEEQLASQHDVSRVTIRGALDLLEKSGLISRMRGRGTVVSPPKIVRRFAPIYSFEEDLKDQGIDFKTRVISYEPKLVPSESVRQRLGLPRRSNVGCLRLVRIVHQRVVSYECRHYPPKIATRLNPQKVTQDGTANFIEDLTGEPIARVDWESEITSASGDIAANLDVSPRTLVFSNAYVWKLASGTAVDAGTIAYRVDRCKFRFELSFSHARPPLRQGRPNGKD
jgi:GntR family transcriptional regulator